MAKSAAAEPKTNNRIAKHLPGVKRVRVTIKGVAPGLIFQGKGLMELDADKKTTKHRPAAEEAEHRAHWMTVGGKKQLCVPWVMLYQSICTAAASFKFRGRKTMAAIVPATIACEEDRISLGTDSYEVYEDWVRIPPRTGAMVKIGRPRLREWKATFVMIVDDESYDVTGLRDIIADAGKMVGIGAWRAQLKGPYGRFTVEEFEIV